VIAYRARHACGTEVSDDLPDGYPVQEGVGLWCPACREAFWHTGDQPTPEPEPEPEAEVPRFLPPQAPEPPGPEPDAPVKRRRWLR
jgi:hypothetical protein